MAFAEGGGEGENIRRCGASIQAADIRFLDDGAIGHRVGERHAKFNDIRATRDERVEIGRGVAIACRDECDEGWM
jgi:transcriptional regulator of aromatic amino acid metabolism